MAFASPSASSRPIVSVRDTNTVAATYTYPFTIPQDADQIVAKVWLASGWSSSGAANITIQTSEDGGTTWRDVSNTNIGANTVAANVNNINAHFIPIACANTNSAKGATGYVGSVAAASTLATTVAASAVGITTGLPMMSTTGQVRISLAATVSTGGVNVDIFAPTTQLR
jgi:hypothetical protein